MDQQNYFTASENELMCDTARLSVLNYLAGKKTAPPENIPEKFLKRLACFVTIYRNKNLRGCIGTIEPVNTLYNSILENAISAASRDYRFEPIRMNEIDELEFEVSVLSEKVQIFPRSTDELFTEIKNNGVIIKKDFRSAVYLPQVWEHFKSEKDFLSSLCRKAGLFGEEWVDFKSMNFYIFRNLN